MDNASNMLSIYLYCLKTFFISMVFLKAKLYTTTENNPVNVKK